MAFHSNHGLFFQRRDDGTVWVEKRVPLVSMEDEHGVPSSMAVVEHWELDPDSWASVLASMSGAGETADTWRNAGEFHRHGSITDRGLAEHHRQCELAAEKMAQVLRRIIAAGDSDPALFGVDAPAALAEWDKHQWPAPEHQRESE